LVPLGDECSFAPSRFPVAFGAYERLVSLPLSPKLTDDDVAEFIEAVEDILAKNAR
jgi:dTDP-4-amino-4,6-dideoxygalactose transaminase